MRPRLITAENVRGDLHALLARVASMRPRLITAENVIVLGNMERATYSLQ